MGSMTTLTQPRVVDKLVDILKWVTWTADGTEITDPDFTP